MLEEERKRREQHRARPLFTQEDSAQAPAAAPAARPQFYGPDAKVLTLKAAIRKVEAHSLAVVAERGLKSSIRRACAAKLQMPKSSETLSQLTVVACVENVPRSFLVNWLLSLGWTQPSETSNHAELVTDYPKAIGEAMQFERAPNVIGYGCMKLYKPEKEPRGKAAFGLIPPARAVHRVREDGSEVLEMVMNVGIINEVRAPNLCARAEKAPHNSVYPRPVVCTWVAEPLTMSRRPCSQYGRMELTARHRKRGRLVMDFAGYHPEDEDDLFRYLKKALSTIVTNYPGMVSDSLRRVVQPNLLPRATALTPVPDTAETQMSA